MDKHPYHNIDEYIAGFPVNVQAILQKLRQVIREAAPEAEETISYGMPAFRQKNILVYFGGFKGHISLFPTSSGVSAFQRELAPYATSKGTIQFPLDKPIPYELVKKIVQFRVKEVNSKEKK
ncbi:MAG: DUF1801 domain-containing protein [Dehalococcoidales bacterium]|nr:DUF1801 domain-containing protein [Dehalococcoidales bacterium]